MFDVDCFAGGVAVLAGCAAILPAGFTSLIFATFDGAGLAPPVVAFFTAGL